MIGKTMTRWRRFLRSCVLLGLFCSNSFADDGMGTGASWYDQGSGWKVAVDSDNRCGMFMPHQSDVEIYVNSLGADGRFYYIVFWKMNEKYEDGKDYRFDVLYGGKELSLQAMGITSGQFGGATVWGLTQDQIREIARSSKVRIRIAGIDYGEFDFKRLRPGFASFFRCVDQFAGARTEKAPAQGQPLVRRMN